MEENGLTVADALALRNNNGDGAFGGNSAWWVIILVIFLFGGRNWGGYGGDGGTNTVIVPSNSGWGNTGFSTPATAQGVTDAFNFNSLANGITATHDAVIDGFYQNNLATTNLGTAMQTALGQAALQRCQGFNQVVNSVTSEGNAIQNTLCNGFNGVQTTLANNNFNTLNGLCETRESIMQSNFNNQAGFNNVGTAIAANTTAITRGQDDIRYLMAQNQSQTLTGIDKLGDRIIDYMNQSKMDELRSELQNAKFQISQQAQTDDIISTLLPTPRPAYITASPYQAYASNATCACGM